MIKKDVITISLAAGFAAIGLVYLWITVVGGGRGAPSSDNTVVPELIKAAELDAVDIFVEPATPEEGRQVAVDVVDRAFRSDRLADSLGTAGLPNESQLRALIQARIELMYNPDYEVYVDQVGELMSTEGREALKGSFFEEEQMWHAYANHYRSAGAAIESVQATVDFESVTVGAGLMGGRQTTYTDDTVYGSQNAADRGGMVFSVDLPVMLPPGNEPDAQIMVLYATLSFVWDSSRSRWLPYRTAVLDPIGNQGPLILLWM